MQASAALKVKRLLTTFLLRVPRSEPTIRPPDAPAQGQEKEETAPRNGALCGPYLPNRSQTASVCTWRSWASSLPFGAGMFSDIVTAALPSAVAAANWV